MTSIGVDCAGKVAGCCVRKDGEVVWHRSLNEGLTHSETLLPLIETALAETGLKPKDVDAWGVTAGPGSFTGLRIGLSLVKGLCLPFGTPAAPVSTLYALALGSGLRGTVVPALNARRNEVYWAAFQCEGDRCERLTADAAGPAVELLPKLQGFAGPVYVVGDGAEICREALGEQAAVQYPVGACLATACVGVALATEQAAKANELLPAAGIRPEYLRLSQAERERKARMAQ